MHLHMNTMRKYSISLFNTVFVNMVLLYMDYP